MGEGATAVVGFLTVINPSAHGFLRVNPNGTGGGSTGNTGAATINYNSSQNRSSLVMGPVNANGNITIGTNATVDVVFDVTGYYQPGADKWTYDYDSAGLRSTKTGPDGTTKFAWTATGGLPLLLGEHDTNGDTWIIYGPGGQPVSQINTDNSLSWLHHDQIGSVRLTTNATGAVTSTRAWDPYGNPTASTGTGPLLGYTGQYSDAETGLTYLRARYYDPTTNQFLTQDPLVAQTHEPYGYALNSPLNMVDPWGLDSLADECSFNGGSYNEAQRICYPAGSGNRYSPETGGTPDPPQDLDCDMNEGVKQSGGAKRHLDENGNLMPPQGPFGPLVDDGVFTAGNITSCFVGAIEGGLLGAFFGLWFPGVGSVAGGIGGAIGGCAASVTGASGPGLPSPAG